MLTYISIVQKGAREGHVFQLVWTIFFLFSPKYLLGLVLPLWVEPIRKCLFRGWTWNQTYWNSCSWESQLPCEKLEHPETCRLERPRVLWLTLQMNSQGTVTPLDTRGSCLAPSIKPRHSLNTSVSYQLPPRKIIQLHVAQISDLKNPRNKLKQCRCKPLSFGLKQCSFWCNENNRTEFLQQGISRVNISVTYL